MPPLSLESRPCRSGHSRWRGSPPSSIGRFARRSLRCRRARSSCGWTSCARKRRWRGRRSISRRHPSNAGNCESSAGRYASTPRLPATRCVTSTGSPSAVVPKHHPVASLDAVPPRVQARNVPTDADDSGLLDLASKCGYGGEQPRETDTHLRAPNGAACWNWRFKYAVTLSPWAEDGLRQRLLLQLYDKDIFSAHDNIGEAQLDLQSWSVHRASNPVTSPRAPRSCTPLGTGPFYSRFNATLQQVPPPVPLECFLEGRRLFPPRRRGRARRAEPRR